MEELKGIVQMAGIPFILKGVMTPKGALKAGESGVQGIVVSNHGGRVLDQCPSTAEVLPSIVKAVRASGSQMKIFVDGGIRTGVECIQSACTRCRCRPDRASVRDGSLWRTGGRNHGICK